MPLSWPDINLPHGWHLNTNWVSVPTVPQSDHARAAEIRNRRAALQPALRRDPDYALDSPMWDVWFATEHDVRRRASFEMEDRAPPPLVVVKEEEAATL